MSLPSGYTRLEYIESSGTQWVDTGFKPDQDTRIVCDCQRTAVTTTFPFPFGTRTGLERGFDVAIGATQVFYHYGANYQFADFAATGDRMTIDANKNVATFTSGNTTVTITNAAATFQEAGDAVLFSMNEGGNIYTDENAFTGKIWSVKIYDNGTLIRDFIPCKNASGAVGLWDDVGSQFYGNAGTGAFTAGPEVLGSHKVMVGGTIYDVTAGQCMVGGTVYGIRKGLTMIGGTVYEIPLTVPVQGTPVGNLPVGTIVKTPVNGTAKEFIVVHQGLPSSLYDASCSGTWLLMKDCYESRAWHSSNVNDYANSTIHSYLNSTFLAMFGSNIQKAIKQVKLPYRAGSGYGKAVTSGASGLSAKIFLLSSTEVNLVHGNEPTNEGACLSYFSGTAQNGTDTKRVAYLNGSAANWWLRSPVCNSGGGSQFALVVYSNGYWLSYYCSDSHGIRPAFILPSDALVDENMNLLA